MKTMYVYWYHLESHVDKHLNGYVGVTTDLVQRHYHHSTGRTNAHLANAFSKYGSNIIKDILFEGTTEECLALETALRPTCNIGWNIACGGGLPPVTVSHSEETKRKIGEGNKGKNLGRVSMFKGMTDRHSDEMKAHLGSFHKGKTISDAHKKAISDKMSGSDSPKAVGISLVHVDKPHVIQTFGCIKEASDELGINYSSLRSQFRLGTLTSNKKGWRIVYDN